MSILPVNPFILMASFPKNTSHFKGMYRKISSFEVIKLLLVVDYFFLKYVPGLIKP
jgi:hypothetical protein